MSTATQMVTDPPLWVLDRIWWEERVLDLRAEGRVDLPPFAGSTVRGALGTVMRPALCGLGGACGEECAAPARCQFHALFEQSRAGGGAGENRPRPMILEVRLGGRDLVDGPGLGGTRTTMVANGRGGLPAIADVERRRIAPGGRVEVVLRGLGQAGASLDGVVEAVRREGLEVKGGRLKLAGVEGGRRVLAGTGRAAEAGRVKLDLATPTMIRAGAGICHDPAMLGRVVLEQVVVRAVQVYNHLFAAEGERAPFVRVGWPGVALARHSLSRYVFARRSYHQDRWMEFDGVMGWMEWEGQVAPLLPWLRAAEVLHVGQKAAFGMGQVALIQT